MKKIYMYAHGGSGNHGCEAIVRSTIKLLDSLDNEKILISSKPEEDIKYGVDKICSVLKDKNEYSKFNISFLKAYYELKIKKNYIEMDKLPFIKTISQVKKGDIALSIGGDNYCYADVEKYIMLHDMFLKQGARTVLWGCSIEPELVEVPKIKNDLKRYSLITARETISYEALKKVNPNTILVSDPAFSLNKVEMEKEYTNSVGINISPMIIENESIPGIAIKNYQELIKNILDNTDMNVLLVPHVVWEKNDDREPLTRLYNEFKDTGRVELIEDYSCEKIKGIISKCRYFIGARTHSTIAAYSTCIPTLVIGYSVKARGIAKDLFGTYEGYVIPVQTLKDKNDVKNAFQKIMDNESEIKQALVNNKNKVEMTQYEVVSSIINLMR